MRSLPASLIPAILQAGLLAAVLDLVGICLAVYLYRGVLPSAILQSVAMGVVGPGAVSGSWAIQALGLVVHTLIAIWWAAVFAWAALQWPSLRVHWLVAGLVFGLLVWLAMNFIALPYFSHVPNRPFTWTPITWANLACHLFLVGLPIAWVVRNRLP